MGCWHHHHCGPYWDWAPLPYSSPAPPIRRGERYPNADEVALLQEHLRRLEAETARVRRMIEDVSGAS